ncbi:tRNA (adenosine(37)-N6)-dimethylallyltransferase MiaA [Algoriphagus sediminis]|uniref:tRNA dimethylallyltransferase n=1 Tax=Algoriphagus sediminis TaxID=3057113 RepID=A0ABT7Y7R7_9BACT|nr:tRNA (adenosine(37)-N6)-dimethylallyltransferase MiaA [Algoriphagus sediminis]MDN3202561.1 tRNA (adenosine(37)-N6)-dimethylallyltransferase MiaA [Algoriphagus sediminis]
MTLKKPKKYLILIVGPTAVGKTSLSIKVAKNLQTEIISCDSRQFYCELEIGTAKPSQEELDQVPHHLINSRSIHENYDVKKFEQDALAILDKLYKSKNLVVMTGGSGLFADAITNGFDPIPEIPKEIREELIDQYERLGLKYLQDELLQADSEFMKVADIQNPNRLMRALEVFRGTGKPFSSFRNKALAKRNFETIQIGVEMERKALYDRINQRMDLMIDKGLFEEAEKFFPLRHLNALQTVGYSEVFGYLEGEYDREEAIRLLKRNSRRYAKRQMTWFKRNPKINWFEAGDEDGVLKYIQAQLMG